MDNGHRVVGAAQAALLLERLVAHIEEYNKP